jgi:hypothetical protein
MVKPLCQPLGLVNNPFYSSHRCVDQNELLQSVLLLYLHNYLCLFVGTFISSNLKDPNSRKLLSC